MRRGGYEGSRRGPTFAARAVSPDPTLLQRQENNRRRCVQRNAVGSRSHQHLVPRSRNEFRVVLHNGVLCQLIWSNSKIQNRAMK